MEFKIPTQRNLIIVGIIAVLLVIAGVYFAWQKHSDTANKLQQAVVLTAQQAQDVNVLQNELKLSNQNAEMLAQFIAHAQAGQVEPVTKFIVQAPDVNIAAQQVTNRINAKDPSLPPAALEKTDNTIVTPHELTPAEVDKAKKDNEVNKGTDKPKINEQFGVDVFKNNNYRNWEWSAGYGQHHGDGYIPIGLQRNYFKDMAIDAEIHLDPNNIKKISGWEVKQVWKTDKLFVLF